MHIGYFADGPWSHRTLEKLIHDDSLKIDFICARHDKPDQELELASKKYDIDFLTHPNINSDEFLRIVSNYNCNLFVSMSFNQIFRNKLINTPSLGSINCHAGKLPFYRGRNILNWVLINDEKEFGITVHYIDEGIDTGDIIQQKTFEINDEDNYSTLLEKAYTECSLILYNSIKILQSGDVTVLRQIDVHPLGSYCSARIEGDERLDWNQTSREVFNFVRAVCEPGPQARTWLNEIEIKINQVELFVDSIGYKGIPGSVIGLEKEAFIVKTSDSFVRVKKWSGYGLPRVGDRFRCPQ
jgi:methionyl-tRNA formyltransferase